MNPIQTVEICSEEQMQQFGLRLAANFQIGDLVVLEGPLGAGKTRLAQSIGKGLLVKNQITSPTFVIAKNYLGRVQFIHADAYRLLDSPTGGLQDLDLDTENSVTVVEWGKNFAKQLNDQYLLISISIIEENKRELVLSSVGERWKSFTL
ncbi:MAG: tRNA (adenosine(37)-N6)-threonylcarbamoyltransferase complex ATPase subunit type 1 TsaE [Actinobacteria bacterium]|nr:tRNA (adenosine(37)-N6)-threonylcarbamoyltransferase complex ATPase subunit type 1 TsaE [Actinomycetota bacterium]